MSLYGSEIRSWTSGVILMKGTVEAGHTSIEHHRGVLPNDAARGRPGDRIRTGMVASTGHQGGRTPMVKPPPLAGRPRGAPRLRPTQTRGNEAWAAACRPWAPEVRAPAGQRAA